MQKLSRLLFYYSCGLVLFITASSLLVGVTEGRNLIFQIIFLPIPLYFGYLIALKVLRRKKLLEKNASLITPPIKEKSTILLLYLAILAPLLGYSIGNVFFPSNFLSPLTQNRVVQTNQLEQAFAPLQLPAKESPTPQPTPAKAQITIREDNNSGFVNVREKPELASSVITQIKAGSKFEFVKKEPSGWYQIKLPDGRLGWIDYNYVVEAKDE